jgi:hypothetical protein
MRSLLYKVHLTIVTRKIVLYYDYGSDSMGDAEDCDVPIGLMLSLLAHQCSSAQAISLETLVQLTIVKFSANS